LKLEAPYVKVMVDPEKYAIFIEANKKKCLECSANRKNRMEKSELDICWVYG